MVSSKSFEWMLVEEFPTSSIWPRPWHCSASLCVDHYVMTFPGRYLCSYIFSSKDCCGFWCILQLAWLCPWLENKIFFKWVAHLKIVSIFGGFTGCWKPTYTSDGLPAVDGEELQPHPGVSRYRGAVAIDNTTWDTVPIWWSHQFELPNLMAVSFVLNIKYHVIITMQEPSIWVLVKLHFGGWDCFTA